MKREPFFVPCDKLRNVSASPVLCKNEPISAGALAASFLNSFISQEQKDVMLLESLKAQILPGKLQEKVKITAISKEMLLLKAASSVWRAETMALKTSIIASCNRILGRIAIKAIRIV